MIEARKGLFDEEDLNMKVKDDYPIRCIVESNVSNTLNFFKFLYYSQPEMNV